MSISCIGPNLIPFGVLASEDSRKQSTMHPKRRSGRIAKQLPIVLLGTDTSGKVFAEETKTVVLSRHGAGVLSKYRLAPDEVLTLRLRGSAKEADVRLVGKIGEESGSSVYGLAFVEPNLEFWQMDFPPPEEFEPGRREISLQCTFCHCQQTVQHDEIEEDVYAVNERVLRFCRTCGISTPWIQTRGDAALESIPAIQATSPAPLPASSASQLLPRLVVSSANSVEARGGAVTASLAAPSEFRRSAYSGAALETVTTALEQIAPPQPERPYSEPAESLSKSLLAKPKPTSRPLDSLGRPVNRRKHLRVRVKFSACVRHPELGEEIVECEDVSKGGLCFRSKRKYAPGTTIEIAAPFSPGEAALFLSAKIQRAEPLGESQFFRYGAAYLGPHSAA